MPDYSNPLINNTYQERLEYNSNLLFEWVTSTQIKDLNDVVQERTFSELEFFNQKELSLQTGSPPGHPDSYSYHYKLRSLLNDHSYSGFKFVAEDEEFSQFNEFYGWKYDLNEFYRIEYYSDDLINYAVWNIYSRGLTGTPTTDVIKLYNSEGTEINSTNVPENTTLNLSTGIARGIRTQSSDSDTPFKLKIENTVINTFGSTAPNSVPVNNLSGYQPVINNANVINIEYPTERPIETDIITNLPIVLHQIKVFFYGNYWTQDLALSNVYEQGWVLHPAESTLLTRLKPPNKAYLSDVYNNETNTNITSNYTQTNTITSGTIV
jgi:hypothetical protein